jgi:hypothetical protein
MRVIDAYFAMNDGYTENPFAHHFEATSTQKENEYYMQWVFPEELHRVALRTPAGFRLTYGYAKDLWNNNLGIKIPDEKEKSSLINRKLTNHLMSRNWYKEMEKVSGYEKEQGESILLCYYGDEFDSKAYMKPVSDYDEILKVEAINKLEYWIPEFDQYGEPKLYRVTIRTTATTSYGDALETVDIHPSRVLRKCGDNIEFRHSGYSELAVVYDNIVILSTIVKSAGEAAFRWGTGHPTIFTKDLINTADFEKLQSKIGDFTRRSWHMLPSEYVDRIDMLGQAGSMLNLKALSDIAMEEIVVGSGFPRPILLGEVAGVVSGSEVNERTYFALLDTDHTELEPFIRAYFQKDLNVRKLLHGVDFYDLDWGIREVMNKRDEVEHEQKVISNILALTTIASINECRKMYGLDEIPDEEYGDVILGLQPFYMMEMELQMRQLEMQAMASEVKTKESQNATNYKQSAQSTSKQKASTQGDLEKNKRVAPKMDSLKDFFDAILKTESINSLSKKLELYPKTINKMIKNGDKVKIDA